MPTISKQTAKPAANHQPKAQSDDAWALSEWLRVLLYGKSGSGKTTLWATFPGPIKALICSGGTQPGELRSIDTPEYRRKIKPVVIRSMRQFDEELRDAANFATHVLDHGSGMADLILKELMGLDDILIAKYRIAGKGESWSVVSQQQYGQLAIQCKEAFRSLLNLPSHVVIVAQERTFGEESAGDLIRPTVGAALTPSVTGWLNPACDYVVQTYLRPKMAEMRTKGNGKVTVTSRRVKDEVEYCLRTAPHDVFMTKFRLPMGRKLPDCLVDPTFEKIDALIRGNG